MVTRWNLRIPNIHSVDTEEPSLRVAAATRTTETSRSEISQEHTVVQVLLLSFPTLLDSPTILSLGDSSLISTYRLKNMSHPTTTSAIAVVTASINDGSSSSNQKSKKGPRGGIYDPFPLKFHRALEQIRDEGMESIVSWVPHGRAFKIHKPKVFAATISKIRLVVFLPYVCD